MVVGDGNMTIRVGFVVLMLALLVSCADLPKKQEKIFDLNNQSELYGKEVWSFEGRLAVVAEKDSFSATIKWLHAKDEDTIELSGPFGQGRTIIRFNAYQVYLDDGGEVRQYYGDVDKLVSEQLGVKVPVSALKFWLLGLVKPGDDYVERDKGFIQLEWLIHYPQMQQVGLLDMPRKIRVTKQKTKLKLIIDQWSI